MSADINDPFATPEEASVPVRGEGRMDSPRRGRYYLPWKNGEKKSHGFMRVSNLVSAYSDQFRLRLWELGEFAVGIEKSPELYAAILAEKPSQMERAQRRAWVEHFIERAKDASGGNIGSKHGNLHHAAVEGLHAGLPIGHYGPMTRHKLALYEQALIRHKLRAMPGMQERRVLVEELEVVGTLDNILQDLTTLSLYVGDLKTQKKFWTFLEIGAQFACYAHGDAMWNPEKLMWEDMPKVSLDLAHILWMPRLEEGEEPRVEVYDVDIVAGWETAKLARKIVLDRSGGKSTTKPRAWVRAAPSITEEEKMAARFATVETLAEGRKLTEEAKKTGTWTPQVSDAAKVAFERVNVPA